MATMILFTPLPAGTVTITCAATTANVALGPKGNKQVRVKNIDLTNVAYISFGNSSVVATLPVGATGGSMPIGPGETAGFTIGDSVTNVAAICSAGTPIVYFTVGNGI